MSCLHADTALMLNPEYVPQHLLILACVLRYIMAASQGTILQKQELDAFIVQAFAMEMTNPNYLQDLQVFWKTRPSLYWFLHEDICLWILADQSECPWCTIGYAVYGGSGDGFAGQRCMRIARPVACLLSVAVFRRQTVPHEAGAHAKRP